VSCRRVELGLRRTLLTDQCWLDMVSMARPFLADPEFVRKTEEGRVNEINTCIGCNQACLDHTFKGITASCLVNPRSGYETLLNYTPTEGTSACLVQLVLD
jgi:2,4-dienoyl-CoA reductase (NADPH2)